MPDELAQKTILIVDDERSTCKMFAEKLHEAGFLTEEAYDGQEGLQKIMSVKPDLVILDILMPFASGVDLLKTYAQQAGTRGGIPFIIVTNLDVIESISGVFDQNITDVVSKSGNSVEDIVRLVCNRLSYNSPGCALLSRDVG